MKRSERNKIKTNPTQPHPQPETEGRNQYERHVSGDIHVRGEVEIDIAPDLIQKHDAERHEDKTNDNKKFFWGTIIQVITVFGIFLAAGFALWQALSANESAKQAITANVESRQSLKTAQGAYVSLGRKDGVIADFVVPKDKKQNAEIVMFFQNSGHLPAKFAWGTSITLIGTGSKGQSGIKYTHPYRPLPVRTRDKKTGSVGERGESSIIPGDSVLATTMGEISQEDLALLPEKNESLVFTGMYEYCDELGDHRQRMFALRYRSDAPSASLSFDLMHESDFPILPLAPDTDTVQYLPPCETVAERQQNEEKMKPISPKPWYRRMF